MRWWGVLAAGCSGMSIGVDSGPAPIPARPVAKDSLYVAARTARLVEVGRTDEAVSCDRAGDVLLTGSCDVLGDARTYAAYATGLDDPEVAATWHCGVEVASVGAITSVAVAAECLPAR